MTKILLPPPPRGQGFSKELFRWFLDLRAMFSNDGQFTWDQVDKTGSDLADIETRPHSALQSILAADDTDTDAVQVKHVSNVDMKTLKDNDAKEVDDTSTNATKDKHVSDLLAKSWSDSVDLLPLHPVENEDDRALHEALRAASVAELALAKATATGWDDFVIPVTQGKQGNVGRPNFDYTNLGYLFPKNDTGEILYLVAQLPHAWRQGGNIYPHVHLVQDADVAYVMKADYKWFNPAGDAIPGSWTTYTMSNQVATYSAGSISQILNNATPIDGSGFTISSILLIKLYRDDNVGSNDLLVQSFDFHLEKDGLGSEDEYLK